MNETLLQQLIDEQSKEFRMIFDAKYRRKILGEDREISIYRNMRIDPLVEITSTKASTRKEPDEAFGREIHDTLIRYYTYPRILEKPYKNVVNEADKQAIMRFNRKALDFNTMVTDAIVDLEDEAFYRTEDEIRQYLTSLELPSTLEGLNIDEIFKLRKKYPYAWFDIDLSIEWKKVHEELYEKYFDEENAAYAREPIERLNEALKNKWSNKSTSKHYEIYMNILNDLPPLTNSIVLFRGINRKIPKVGDEIVEYGFSSKSYLYSISNKYADKCCTLIIFYPRNHKFHLLLDRNKKQLFEIVSYPGEVLLVDKIEVNGEKTDVFCHFVRYEPHMTPNGDMITPVMTDIFDHMTSNQLSENREQCKSVIYQEGYSIYLTLNPIIM